MSVSIHSCPGTMGKLDCAMPALPFMLARIRTGVLDHLCRMIKLVPAKARRVCRCDVAIMQARESERGSVRRMDEVDR